LTTCSSTLPLALFLYGSYVLGAQGPSRGHEDGDVCGRVGLVRHGVGLTANSQSDGEVSP
jgi:hypothetical protein